jgi:hypothetical protein
MNTILLQKKTSSKTTLPAINTLWLQFNLPLRHGDIKHFREAVLACLPAATDRQIVSNEEPGDNGTAKRITRYPLVQFRSHRGRAAIIALQEGAAVAEKFIQQYCGQDAKKPFRWQGTAFPLTVMVKEKENNISLRLINPKLRKELPVYKLHTWLPFNKENYNHWWKPNHNNSDIEKTKKLEELLLNHLCTFIHHTGGHIPKKKIKLSILDKDRLKKIFYKNEGQVAFDLRYTVNLELPPYIGLGNHPAFGFGWQKREE